MLEGRLDRKPLMQDGNNNKDKQFEWSETGFGSIELFCPACVSGCGFKLAPGNAMIYRCCFEANAFSKNSRVAETL